MDIKEGKERKRGRERNRIGVEVALKEGLYFDSDLVYIKS